LICGEPVGYHPGPTASTCERYEVKSKLTLVTGGAGFIGSNIVAALCDRGDRVVVCDRLRRQEKWRNVAKRPLVDIVAPEALLRWLDGDGRDVDTIIHMGAISSTTETDADLILDVNFHLSFDLWCWCASHGARFIYASSAATYGDGTAGFDDDPSLGALSRLRPLNAYGWSKHLFDQRVLRAVADGDLHPSQWVGLKFFNVYGPNEYHKKTMQSVVAQKFPAAAAGDPITLFRSHRPEIVDGGQQRDFVFVDDCVEVVLWLLDNPEVSGLFNLGSGIARTFEDLAKALCAAVEVSPRISYVDMPETIREKYQYWTEARLDRLRDAGYRRPFTSLEDGVARYVRQYLMQPDPYR
jgi:ADP-L-glycero-D-manno-heptose 6-epimerase